MSRTVQSLSQCCLCPPAPPRRVCDQALILIWNFLLLLLLSAFYQQSHGELGLSWGAEVGLVMYHGLVGAVGMGLILNTYKYLQDIILFTDI